MPLQILVIDGQGGRIGQLMVEAARKRLPQAEVTAVGTNSLATGGMRKAGPHRSATGENAVVVCSRRADIIVGPIGIVIADALLGEVTPAMAAAVGQSQAEKLLIPMNRCGVHVVGQAELPLGELAEQAGQALERLAQSLCP